MYISGLLRFTLHLLACKLHYTFESEVKYVPRNNVVQNHKSATSLRENLDLSHVVLLRTLKIFVAIQNFKIDLPAERLDCFVLHYTY